MRTTLLATVICLQVGAALAATPGFRAIRPPGGQRGTEIEVTLSGERLGDAQELVYYQSGLETISLSKVDDNSVKAKLRIAADCPLGLHDLRVRTATGISELRVFSVGAYPEVSETEPNNDFAAPQSIPMNVLVNGVAENEDIDYFVVDAKKGERLSAEVEGIRLGIAHFDPYVAIMDTKRFELAASDDRALVRQDGSCSIIAPEDGKYVIAVRESAFSGNGNCLYRLHVGHFPRPTATIPAGAKPGESVQVTWIGDPMGPRTTPFDVPSEGSQDPNFPGLLARDDQGEAPFPNAFRVIDLPNTIEVEPNNDHASATAFTPPAAVNGVIEKDDDTDFFAFTATKGQVFDVNCYARRLRSPLDSVMHVARRNGAYIAGADDSAGPDSYIRFTAPEDGEYVVYLHDQLKKGGPDFFYRIELTPVAAKTVMSVTAEEIPRGTGAIAVAVPRGNLRALLVSASRADWGGDLKVDVPNLPQGVSLQAEPIAASQPSSPILFAAAADAPLGVKLVEVMGAPLDPNVKAEPSHFEATSVLVLGANNVNFYSRTVNRIPVTVVEEAPFSLEIVEPKVPLVRNGTLNLKVVAKRKDDFKAPIALELPWAPPGVSAQGGISIPEGQNEALIPVNANGGAELRSWKVVANGNAGTPAGPMTVSTQLATLRVEEPFVALTYQNGAVEQGKEVDFLVSVAKLRDFPGEATVNLMGLPNTATAEPQRITQDSKDIVFKIKTTDQTPEGTHKSLFCQVILTQNDEPIVHNIGTGTLRVDKPLPPKANEPAPAPAPQPAAPAPAPEAAPAKPLSRLEMLRKEAAERANSQTQGEQKP